MAAGELAPAITHEGCKSMLRAREEEDVEGLGYFALSFGCPVARRFRFTGGKPMHNRLEPSAGLDWIDFQGIKLVERERKIAVSET